MHTRRVLGEVWIAARGYHRRTLIALGLLLLAKLLAVAVPLVLKAVIDRLGEPPPLASLAATIVISLLVAYAVLRFASTLFTELRDLVFSRVAQNLVIGFSQRCFAHLLQLGPRFHVSRDTGVLVREVERGTAGFGFLLGAGVFTIVPTAVEFLAVLAVLAAGYDVWFSLVVIATFFVYAGYTTQLTGRRVLRQRKVNEMDSRAHGRLVDTLLNYETVKTHAREGFEERRYGEICAQWIDTAISNQRALSALHIGQGAIIAAGVATVMLLAGERTMQGAMTVGDLVLVNAYVIQICLPLNALGFVFREARDALVNIEQVFRLLDRQPESDPGAGTAPLRVSGGAVAFEHVDFSYEAGRPILMDVSLAIQPGETVAVVGGSGSGKSTLARLLLRLYDPDAGRVLVDGQDLRQVQLHSLREAVGAVPQDTVLFNDTIAYNIGYGRLGASHDEIVAAAQAAQVHEFVLSLPQQYETVVGERGVKLSGGERQRLAIARAFLKNPPIMIFDEATSALDSRAERAIQGELDRIAQGRTTLVIAHRLSTIVDADQIVVMDKGRIVERGRHGELLQRDGLYAQMWNLQLQQEQVERLERRLARQAVNLVALAAQALDSMRGEIEASGVRMYAGIDLAHARVIGDPGTLADVLGDLLRVALQATPPGGRMELRLEALDGYARLSVIDGLHAGDPAVLLSPATGIGSGGDADASPRLPPDPLVLRSLIERQGGRFAVEPRSQRAGACYRIELPLHAAAAPPAAAHTPAAPTGAALAGLRLMCVDHRADELAQLQAVLVAEGATVLPLASGAEAVGWLQAQPSPQWPHGLVCATVLGDEDGFDVLRRVRRIEADRGIALADRMPAIAIGREHQDGATRALLSGFQLQLARPIDGPALVHAVRTLVGPASPAG